MPFSALLSRYFHLSADRDLHDAQETVENYKHKIWIGRLLYSKSNNDDLQRLEKRVNNTLSLFQVGRIFS